MQHDVFGGSDRTDRVAWHIALHRLKVERTTLGIIIPKPYAGSGESIMIPKPYSFLVNIGAIVRELKDNAGIRPE